MECTTPVNVLLSTAGVILNLANITVFLLQDWKTNNVTLTLLSLSVTDLLVLLTSLVFDLFSGLQAWFPSSWFDLTAVQYYIVAWTLAMFSDISSLTTVLVSLERCLCIITPLHVQTLFSVSRTRVALAIIWALVLLSYSVLFSTTRLEWARDATFNISKLTVGLSWDRIQVEMGHNITNTIILPSFCEITVCINTVVMVIGLRRSSRFQKRSVSLSSKSGHKISSSDHSSGNLATTSTKYNRVVNVICTLSGVFILCNTPTVIIVYCKQFVPGFSYAGVYRESYVASMYAIFLLYALNASVNFFVYFSLNKRHRDKLREVIGHSCFGQSKTT